MDARLRELYRRVVATGDPLLVQEYLGTLRRTGEFALRVGSDARFAECVNHFFMNNPDLFLNFLRLQYLDLASLFSITDLRILFVWLSNLETHILDGIQQYLTDNFLGEEGSFVTRVASTASCQEAEVLLLDRLEPYGVAELDAITASCLTISEIESVFGMANCLAPTIVNPHLLNWRGQRLGDLVSLICHRLRDYSQFSDYDLMDDPSANRRVLRLSKLGVLLPWYSRRQPESPANQVVTTEDLFNPETSPVFIFEVQILYRGNVQNTYWDLYTRQTEITASPFAFAYDHGVFSESPLSSLLNSDDEVISLLNSWGPHGTTIRTQSDHLNQTFDVVVWLPHDLPNTPIVASPPVVCPACARLAPYKKLCRKHAP